MTKWPNGQMKAGGGGEIRTRGPLRVAGFQDRWFQPLTHPSVGSANHLQRRGTFDATRRNKLAPRDSRFTLSCGHLSWQLIKRHDPAPAGERYLKFQAVDRALAERDVRTSRPLFSGADHADYDHLYGSGPAFANASNRRARTVLTSRSEGGATVGSGRS